MKRVNAVVLGGRPNEGRLREVSPVKWEALIEIEGVPMVERVLRAIRGCKRVGEIVAVCPEDLGPIATYYGAKIVPPRIGLVDAITAGTASLPEDRMVLVATSDIPLIVPQDVEAFLGLCDQRDADFYYPVVLRDAVEKLLPGSRRTYYPTDAGVVTGGNLMLVNPKVIERFRVKAEYLYRHRKNPIAMGLALGPGFVARTLLCGLKLASIEKRFGDYLGLRAAAIVMDGAAVGVDVDKPEDYRLVLTAIARRGEGSRGGSAAPSQAGHAQVT